MPRHPGEVEAQTRLFFRIRDLANGVLEIDFVTAIRIDLANVTHGFRGPIFPPAFARFGPFLPARILWFSGQWTPKKFFLASAVRDIPRTKGIIQDVAGHGWFGTVRSRNVLQESLPFT